MNLSTFRPLRGGDLFFDDACSINMSDHGLGFVTISLTGAKSGIELPLCVCVDDGVPGKKQYRSRAHGAILNYRCASLYALTIHN